MNKPFLTDFKNCPFCKKELEKFDSFGKIFLTGCYGCSNNKNGFIISSNNLLDVRTLYYESKKDDEIRYFINFNKCITEITLPYKGTERFNFLIPLKDYLNFDKFDIEQSLEMIKFYS